MIMITDLIITFEALREEIAEEQKRAFGQALSRWLGTSLLTSEYAWDRKEGVLKCIIGTIPESCKRKALTEFLQKYQDSHSAFLEWDIWEGDE